MGNPFDNDDLKGRFSEFQGKFAVGAGVLGSLFAGPWMYIQISEFTEPLAAMFYGYGHMRTGVNLLVMGACGWLTYEAIKHAAFALFIVIAAGGAYLMARSGGMIPAVI